MGIVTDFALRRASGPLHLTLVLAAVAALAAVVGVGRSGPAAPELAVLVVDVSGSVGAPGALRPAELLQQAAVSASVERVAVVTFAEGAGRVLAPVPRDELPSEVSAGNLTRHGSDPAAGLRVASDLIARAAARGPVEVVVIGDGRSTAGDTAAAALALRQVRGVTLRFHPLTPTAPRSRVLELLGPSSVVRGRPFVLEARGVAVSRVTVELTESGRVVDRRAVPPGAFRVGFTRALERSTPARFAARITEQPDTAAGERVPRAERIVVVESPGGRLWIADEPPPLPATGADTWMRPDAVDASDRVGAAERVVLYDLPTAELPRELRATLLGRVRSGASLLLVGGERQRFDAADGVSPLVHPRGGTEPVRVHLAVDGSGSMATAWADGGATKDAIVRAAAAEWLRRADTQTRLSVRRFSERLLGPPPAAGAELTDERRRELSQSVSDWPAARGGTVFIPMLTEAHAILGAGRASARSLVVLSDGRTAEDAAALNDTLRKLTRAGVELLLLVPGGSEVSPVLLEAWTLAGGSVESQATAADVLPRFLAAERQARTRGGVRTEVAIAFDAGEFGALNVPTPRDEVVARSLALDGTDDARVLARDDQGDPVLAWRREGLGTVLAVAGSVGDPNWWGSVLRPGDEGGELAALQAVLASAAERGVRATVTGQGAVEVVGAAASPCVAVRTDAGTELPLVPHGPGTWRARFAPHAVAAARWFEIVDADGEVLTTVGVGRGPGPEYDGSGVDDSHVLAALAEAPPEGESRRAVWLVLALGLLVLWASPPRPVRNLVGRFKVLAALGR